MDTPSESSSIDALDTKPQLLAKVVEILCESFKLDAAQIRPESDLYNELAIDSIDAIDLLVKLQRMTGRRIRPEAFRQTRTVQDVVDTVHALLQQQ
jgi:acyl carrier protein